MSIALPRRKGYTVGKGGEKMRKLKITPLRVMAVLALLSVLGAAAVIWQLLSQSTNELFSTRADVTIPNLVGRSETEAAAEMESAGLTVVLAYRNGDEAAGTVCSQTPRAGRTVKEGQQLTLTVSEGPRLVTLPEVRRMPQREATDLLRQEGLAVTVEFISDNTVDAYTVVRCDPEPGTQLTAGQLVRLVVVRPQADPFRAVPRVIGLSVQQAKDKLLQAGLHAEVMGGAQDGTVTAQDPLPSHLLHANGGVKLYIN